jgi:hypothetical protein
MLSLRPHPRGLAAALALLGLLATSASATVLFTETFDYPDGTVLNGSGGWVNGYFSAGAIPFVVNDGALDLTDMASASARDFTASAFASGSVCYGFDFSLSTASSATNGNFFAALASAPNGSNVRTQQGKIFARNSGSGYVIGVTASASTSSVQYGSSVYDFGTIHRVVVEYNFVDGLKNNTASVYVDGVLLATASWDATTEASLIAFFRPHTSSNTPTLSYFDNLVLATTYAEAAASPAAPIPEPSAWATLAGAAGLALAARRRRRRA